MPVLFLFSATAFAAEASAELTLQGIISSQESIEVEDDGVILDPLGAGYYNVKVGSLTLNSNNAGGFQLVLASTNAGDIAQGPAANERVAYKVNLANLQGNLGQGISVGNLYGIDPDGGIMEFRAYGNNALPTVDARYDIQVNTVQSNDLVGGDQYIDTLTISITTL